MSARDPVPVWAVRVEQGRLVVDRKYDFARYVAAREGQHLELVLRPRRVQRSTKANAYYWSVVVRMVAEYCGYTDEEAEEKGHEAEGEAQDDDYKEYKGKVLRCLNYVLHYGDIELIEGKKGKYYLAPLTSWEHSAEKVAEVITGYGTFEYPSGKSLKDTGPYSTYSKAVIQHLHWLKHGPEIYGDGSYSNVMDR